MRGGVRAWLRLAVRRAPVWTLGCWRAAQTRLILALRCAVPCRTSVLRPSALRSSAPRRVRSAGLRPSGLRTPALRSPALRSAAPRPQDAADSRRPASHPALRSAGLRPCGLQPPRKPARRSPLLRCAVLSAQSAVARKAAGSIVLFEAKKAAAGTDPATIGPRVTTLDH